MDRGPFAFWGRWLVIYKIKSIKDLSLGIINGIRCLTGEHKGSLTRMGSRVLSKDEDGKGGCVVLFVVHQRLIKRLRWSLQSGRNNVQEEPRACSTSPQSKPVCPS